MHSTSADERNAFGIDRIRTTRALADSFTPPEARDAFVRLADSFAAADYRTYPWPVLLGIHATEEQIRVHLPASIAAGQPLEDPGQEHAQEHATA